MTEDHLVRFEARELSIYVEFVPADQLQLEHVYFIVSFFDKEMLIPELTPFVFIGRDLEDGDSGILYFQDYESYESGARYVGESSGDAEDAEVRMFPEKSSGVCEYERALDSLLRCSLRRQAESRRIRHDR